MILIENIINANIYNLFNIYIKVVNDIIFIYIYSSIKFDIINFFLFVERLNQSYWYYLIYFFGFFL